MSEYESVDWSDGVEIREPWYETGVSPKAMNELPGLWVGTMEGYDMASTVELVNYYDRQETGVENSVLVEAEDIPELVAELTAWHEDYLKKQAKQNKMRSSP